MFEITDRVADIVVKSGVQLGLCVVYCRHTSASLLIQENADPTVMSDLLAWFGRMAPDDDPAYRHRSEGPDDMPAHLRSVITNSSETVPVRGGKMALGTWQGIYLAEHRTHRHQREIVVHVMGE